jgi:hypothetical protein
MSASGGSGMEGALLALIEESLAMWGVRGAARMEAGAIVIEAAEHHVRIARAEVGVPFRWSIVVDGRRRVAGSVTGLLRTLRMGLDPDFQPSRIRVAPLDVLPQ